MIATVRTAGVVGVIVTPGSWSLIELQRPYTRIRGHVNATELRPAGDGSALSIVGGGSGFSMPRRIVRMGPIMPWLLGEDASLEVPSSASRCYLSTDGLICAETLKILTI